MIIQLTSNIHFKKDQTEEEIARIIQKIANLVANQTYVIKVNIYRTDDED